jgi:hypothetical protein
MPWRTKKKTRASGASFHPPVSERQVGAETTMSPATLAPRAGTPHASGKERTFVGRSRPRYSRFQRAIAASPTTRTRTSAPFAERRASAARAYAFSRRPGNGAGRRSCRTLTR